MTEVADHISLRYLQIQRAAQIHCIDARAHRRVDFRPSLRGKNMWKLVGSLRGAEIGTRAAWLVLSCNSVLKSLRTWRLSAMKPE